MHNNIKYLFITLSVSVLLVISGINCNRDDTKGAEYSPIEFFDTCIAFDYDVQLLSFGHRPNAGYSLEHLYDTTLKYDRDGVILIDWEGRYYYHPVAMCHKAYTIIAAYHFEQDTAWLRLAEKYAHRLVREAMEYDGALYFPYHFDYRVHKRKDALLTAPWFSGMAQGEALGVMTRLFDETGDSVYLEFAHKTFKSMLRLKGEAEPWTSFVDERGCYWIEEYPTYPPSMTLNGFITAIFGVYDYYQATKSDTAARVLKDCFNTVKNYIPLFRRPGKVSYYDLTFRHYDAAYHRFHINQLRHLQRMSGDDFFGKWADSLEADYDGEKE